MDYWVIAVFSVLGVAGLVVALYFGLNASVHLYLKSKYLTIAEDVSVTNEWSEFLTEKPKRRGTERRHVYLDVPGYEHDWKAKEFGIKLDDGRVVNPQIQMIDKAGLTHDEKSRE